MKSVPRLALSMLLVACTSSNSDEDLMPRPELSAAFDADVVSLESHVTPPPSPDMNEPHNAECLRGTGPYEWLYMPTLKPIKRRPINPRNSATRVHRSRERIVRVEVAHAYTYRPLFNLDQAGVEALRETPRRPRLNLRAKTRPATGKNWPIVLLIYVEGEELPYLGHPVLDELWFAEDDDPWVYSVWVDENRFRDIFPIPVDGVVDRSLEAELGPPDNEMKRMLDVFAQYNERCPSPPPPEPARAFPNIPRAVIESPHKVPKAIIEPATPTND
jgi:hypothetical protein